MNKRLAIIGAGGHGRVVADSATTLGWAVVFFDESRSGSLGEWEIAGNADILFGTMDHFDGVIVAIGANEQRLNWLTRAKDAGGKIVSIIDRSASVSAKAHLEAGSYLGPHSVVNIGSYIGFGCIINTSATVDHDCHLEDGVHLSPGVHLSGSVHVGRTTWLGTGTCVRNNIVIGSNVMAGVGSAIVRNVDAGQTVVGVPARPLEKL